MKFGRKVQVIVKPKDGGEVAINLFNPAWRSSGEVDARVRFNVEKDVELSFNKGQLWIYNLNQKHWNSISHRRLSADFKAEFGGSVEVYAGYEDNPPLIFRGDISEAYTTKEGADYITYINALDGAKIATGKKIQVTASKGETLSAFITKLLAAANATEASYVKPYLTLVGSAYIFKASETYDAPFFEILRRVNRKFKFNARSEEGVIALTQRGVADESKGLSAILPNEVLNAPQVELTGVTIRTLLRPDIGMSQRVTIGSETIYSLNYPGFFVTDLVQHQGDNQQGEFASTIRCLYEDLPKAII